MNNQLMANALRFLSIDAVQQANSGHPGMPMGMADIATVLWGQYLSHDPAHPAWPNRDRFVLSNGHGSMLLYSLLHLSGYDLPIEALKAFRQLHSPTPGHPEWGMTPGVETTTGPLGQGLANAVGMAMAEAHLAAEFNQPDCTLIDHYTYVFLGDGCLMEGISHEASALAGTLKLGKLIACWDDNGISIDGEVSPWFSDDTPARFRAYGWHVIEAIDGHDPEAVSKALAQAKAERERPSLLCCRTTIGFGSPQLAGTAKTHGSPLGETEIKATREALDWPYPPFEIPHDIYQAWDAREKGEKAYLGWKTLWSKYQSTYPEKATEFERRQARRLPSDWDQQSQAFILSTQLAKTTQATRKASQQALNAYAPLLPELFGGSADLTESNLTHWSGAPYFSADHPEGRYFSFGVREFGMSAMANGMALYGGIIPYVGTFLTFLDYARNAVRMAALMKQRVIFVYTHDSIGLGEDGPTHQPVEQAAMLRLTPGLQVWRPCDGPETAVAWQQALQSHGPSALLFSRQALPCQIRKNNQLDLIQRGGYILWGDERERPDIILIATGSEVDLVMTVAKELSGDGYKPRVVSLPSTTTFDLQPQSYRDTVLPPEVRCRLAVEASAADYWYKYVGLDGAIIGLNRFGESAPAEQVFSLFGFTLEHVLTVAKGLLA